jgi:hypothetical protein
MNETTQKQNTNPIIPLVYWGQYGLHVLPTSNGRFMFVGTVPIELDKVRADTYEEAVTAALPIIKKYRNEVTRWGTVSENSIETLPRGDKI